MHAPEVECISKGEAHKRYEFGVKASIAMTNRSSFVVGGMALSGNPYDGHTLKSALDQVRELSEQRIEEVFLDRGYRGHDEVDSSVCVSGQRSGVTARIRKCLKRRQAIEPIIGHMKHNGWLGRRNHLKGAVWRQLRCCGVVRGISSYKIPKTRLSSLQNRRKIDLFRDD